MKHDVGAYLASLFISIITLSGCGDRLKPTIDRFPVAPLTDAEIRATSCLPPENYFKNNVQSFYILPTDQRLGEIYKLLSPFEFEGTDAPPQKAIADCTTNLCRIQARFGADIGDRLIYLLDKFGFNASRYQKLPDDFANKVSLRDFTVSELETIIRTSHTMPQGFHEVGRILPVVRASWTDGVYAAVFFDTTYENSILALADLWAKQSEEFKMYILTHEMGHTLDMDLPMFGDWRNIAGWPAAYRYNSRGNESRRVFDKSEIKRPLTMVTEYSHKNPFEDFAESVSFYRFAPHKLRSHSLEKYNLIKYQVYQGLEFDSEGGCTQPTLCQEIAEDKASNPLSLEAPDCEYLLHLRTLGFSDEDLRKKGLEGCIAKSIVASKLKNINLPSEITPRVMENIARACTENNLLSYEKILDVNKTQIIEFEKAAALVRKQEFETACEDKIASFELRESCIVESVGFSMKPKNGRQVSEAEEQLLRAKSQDFDKECQKYCLIKNPTWKSDLKGIQSDRI